MKVGITGIRGRMSKALALEIINNSFMVFFLKADSQFNGNQLFQRVEKIKLQEKRTNSVHPKYLYYIYPLPILLGFRQYIAIFVDNQYHHE